MKITGFINGKVYVSFKPLRVVEGLLVSGERVLYVGPSSVVALLAKSLGGDIVNLEGRVVVPGFVDAHVHVDSLGLYISTLDLRGVKSIRELKEKLREYANVMRTQWIVGHGWDQELFEEKRWPTRFDLDEVVLDRPVLLTRICLHAGVLNTRALEVTGLLGGGVEGVLTDPGGNPTGVVVEKALEIAREKFRETLGVEDYVELLRSAQDHLLLHGVTTVGFVNCELPVFKALLELWRRRELRIRVRVYLKPADGGVDVLGVLRSLGVKAGFGDEWLRIMGVKLFVDGGLGARTAWLSEPYSDDESTSGLPLMSREELQKISRIVDESGLQLAVHAIGDKAVRTVLDVYSELLNTRYLRHRVEHASLLKDDDLELMRDLGAVAVVQPHFIVSDWWAKSRLGEQRVKWLYRFKSLVEAGVPLAFSTDAPVEPVNPWETVYAAVTRGKYEKVPFYLDTAHESLNVIESLHAYTYGSAYALHSEESLGTLEPGKLADFVVLDRDPLATPERDLPFIRVLEVYVGGVRAWPQRARASV